MKKIPKLHIATLPYDNKVIVDIFKNNQLVTGSHLKFLEKGLSKEFSFDYVKLTSSGYAALFLALKSLDLSCARIVVPLISTCQAITNAVLANGFEVVFCEIDQNHLSLCDENLSKLFREKSFDAIIAPSHFGIPAPIKIYKKYGVPIIEDACQSFFTRTNVKSEADIMVLSFYPTKQFNCIEGGAILYNSFNKSEIINDLRYYDNQQKFDGKARYNFRMANLHAAFGCLSLEKIKDERNSLLSKRDNYINGIKDKRLLLEAQCDSGIIPWRFLIKSNNSDFFDYLKLGNIQVDIEMTQLQISSVDLKQKGWFEEFQSIPFFSGLNQQDQSYIIKKINEWKG